MTKLSMPRCDIEELKGQIEQLEALNTADDYLIKLLEEQNRQLKDVISKMCMELVDPDDDMSNGLAEYFNQDLILEIHEVLK